MSLAALILFVAPMVEAPCGPCHVWRSTPPFQRMVLAHQLGGMDMLRDWFMSQHRPVAGQWAPQPITQWADFSSDPHPGSSMPYHVPGVRPVGFDKGDRAPKIDKDMLPPL